MKARIIRIQSLLFFLILCAISCTEKEELVIQNTVPVFGRVEAIQDGYKFAFSATISIDNPNNPYYVYGFEVSSSADMADATVVAGKGLGNDGAFTGTYDLVGWKGGDVLYYRAFISRREGEEPLYSETFKVDVLKREYDSLKFTSAGKSTIKLENEGGNKPQLYYSYDEFKWTQWDYSELEFTKDKPVYINGDNPKGFSKSSNQYSRFSLSGSPVGCSGSVMTLIDRKNTVDAIPSDWCFTMLFYNCSLLESAPAIPARTLAKSCYSYMFSGTGLAQSPSLPATVMADNCYNGMFSGCKSLKRADNLPAMVLAPWCYSYMFDGCTSLDYEYDLPAEKLEEACYLAMFRNCTSIVKSVTILATETAPKCYRRMFKNCESLIVAPNLSAAVLTEDCYSEMFMGCKKLNLVHCDAIDISAKDCTNNWLSGVASTGTFVKAPGMSDWTRGESGIPVGWNVENSDGSGVIVANKYLTFTSEWTNAISLKNYGDNHPKLYYSYDKTHWKEWGYSDLEFNSDKPLYICGDNPDGFSHSSEVYSAFDNSGSHFSCEGDIMSLINPIEDVLSIPSEYCFIDLFSNCSNLIKAPELPATTLADHCYAWMFWGCSNLQTAPELPATTLASYCYQSMFYSCDKLKTAPSLPATTLADHCYSAMFRRCSNLQTAPELPATTLADSCYAEMFGDCSSLRTAPELPATTLADYCYAWMFSGCCSLQTAPKLPAPQLAKYCYRSMFFECTSLQTVPELPATILAEDCYGYMFYGCSSLKIAPELPANKLADYCYMGMFYGCTSLNSVTCLATNISAFSCTDTWLLGVASTGTFVKSKSMNDWTRGVSGIPEGWNVENSDGSEDIIVNKYLTFSSEGTSSISLKNNGGNAPKLYYSYDKTNWTEWDYSSLEFTSSKPLYLCGDNPDGFSHSGYYDGEAYSRFSASGSSFSCEGDIMSLLDSTKDILIIPSSYCYNKLFYNCSNLTIGPDLPATTLSFSCYNDMFSGCSSLQEAPQLPATSLTDRCYWCMFRGCSSLQIAPELPATTLADWCYLSMFWGCTSLQTAPALPATVLAGRCYDNMFSGCSSLQIAPELPATTLADWCYESMFQDCTSLQTAPALPATVLAERCYGFMFYGCSSLQIAPELPATTLADWCYYGMFRGCRSLNSVNCFATDISAEYCTSGWLYNVAHTGTFVKAKGMNDWTRGDSGIPEEWTVSEK